MSVYGHLNLFVFRDETVLGELIPAFGVLEDHGITYEIQPQGILLEARDSEELFEAMRDIHGIFDEERVISRLQVDETHPERYDLQQEYIDMA